MRLWITLFFVALFAGGACLGILIDRSVLAHADERGVSEGRSGRHGELSMTRVADQLDLSDEQDRDFDRIMGDTQRDLEALSRAMHLSHEQSRVRIHAILTDAQKKKLEELLAAERTKRSEQEVEKSLRLYTSLLALVDSQAAVLKTSLTEGRRARREYFDQRKHGGDHGKIRSDLRKMREEQNRKVETVLKPDQFKRYMEIQELMER